ncbi:hypothetical protein [Gabonibacter chumensis]|uniref:hypothetical protein n=1 Tax=Gabonibacter chumensis TaxID=2972474 RepID=UPI0025732693|nr:hypothetical protein [Gabonibacter chumensis]MCR9010693.1 hypothetical protein [Gabonibacter chumensis]
MNKLENTDHPYPVDSSRGTSLWKINYYRSKILTALLDDFVEMESVGIDDVSFVEIRHSLECFINAMTEVPNTLLSGKPLYEMIEEFLDECQKWSEIKGKDQNDILRRRIVLRKLRKVRQRISNKMRKVQYQLETNTDMQLLSDAYRAMGGIMNLLPDTFRHVGKAVKKYLKVNGEIKR